MLLMENHRLPVSLNLLQGINTQEFSDPLKPPGPGDGIRAGRGGRPPCLTPRMERATSRACRVGVKDQ